MGDTQIRKKGWLVGDKFIPQKSGAAFECWKLYGKPRVWTIPVSMMNCWKVDKKTRLYTDITPDATPMLTDITPDAIPMQNYDPADYLFTPYDQ